MPFTEVGKGCVKRLFQNGTRWPSRKDGGKRRSIETTALRVIRTTGQQDSTSVTHVPRDVVEIEHRQHTAPDITVEDDQIELINLDRKQLPGRKGDQGQLVDRCAVLLFRRAQNGEMHEINRGVGFQEVPPGTFSGMRRTGHQQHPQVLPDPIHGYDSPIV